MLVLPRDCLVAILDHCRGEYPKEACGILAGKDERVMRVYKGSNISDTPLTRYLLDPEEQLGAFIDMERSGLDLLAIYHSHAFAPAEPSSFDRRMAFYSKARYVIISLTNPQWPVVRSFRISEDTVAESALRIAC